MHELSELLLQAREAKKLDLADVAETLKIHRKILTAFESGQFETLPEPALARGFLRRYATYLGLDADHILNLFPGKIPTATMPYDPQVSWAKNQQNQANYASSTTDYKKPASSMWTWLVPLALALLALIGWGIWRMNAAPTPSTIPVTTEVAPSTTPSSTTSTTTTPKPVKPPVTTPEPVSKQVVLSVSSKPTGAEVFLDGFSLGLTPLQVPVSMGTRNLRLERKGYQPYQKSVELGKNVNLAVSLTPVGKAGAVAAPAAQTVVGSASSATSTPTQINVSAPKTQGITIRTEGASWLRIINPTTKRVLFEGTAPAGRDFSYGFPVTVRSGNSGSVRIFINGSDQGLLGGVGQVVTKYIPSR